MDMDQTDKARFSKWRVHKEKKDYSHMTCTRSVQHILIQYFTDPFSPESYAAGLELKRLTDRYGELLNVEYKMGGLIPLWDLYRNNGISTPRDMVKLWRETGESYNLKITGDVWLNDPPHSSFPACIAFKAAQIQSDRKSLAFLQRMSEMLFIENKNISKWEYLKDAALECGLDITRLKRDQVGCGRKSFEDDILLAEELGVLGFPTYKIRGTDGSEVILEGYQGQDKLEQNVMKLIKDPEN